MKGTPGFIGARLREAREVRRITATALSVLADVSPQAISNYENDRKSPSAEALDRIAVALSLPQAFFLRPAIEREHGTIFYRSLTSATKAARCSAEHKFEWLYEIVDHLSQSVDFPKTNFPNVDLPSDPLLISEQDIEALATDVRRYWNLASGPIANMTTLLENQGAFTSMTKLGAEKLDSLSEVIGPEKRPYILVGTDKGSAVRWRFDLGHELGHVLLHRNVPARQFLRADQHKQMESQAHRFASAFLLPLVEFADDVFAVNLDAFRAIKPKWKASIGTMIRRARHAGMLSESSEKNLWINMARRRWRQHEPYDDELAPESPQTLRQAFDLIFEKTGQTPENVALDLSMSVQDVENLSGIPSGYLRSKVRVGSARSPSSLGVADIIPLRPNG